MKTIQAGVVALSALALAGCGGGAKLGGGKQGAAQAAFQAGQASHGAPGALYRLLQDNVGSNLTATVNGDAGGSACSETGTVPEELAVSCTGCSP